MVCPRGVASWGGTALLLRAALQACLATLVAARLANAGRPCEARSATPRRVAPSRPRLPLSGPLGCEAEPSEALRAAKEARGPSSEQEVEQKICTSPRGARSCQEAFEAVILFLLDLCEMFSRFLNCLG